VLRNRLFAQRTVALTSATLALGGSFAPLAIQWGLPPQGAGRPPPKRGAHGMDSLDVGSFDHPRSGIMYVARHCRRRGGTSCPRRT
jgi:ATP-dependent DNA helicase DinG